MCGGSKAIMNKKVKEESLLTGKLKEEFFEKYGGREDISLVDMFI